MSESNMSNANNVIRYKARGTGTKDQRRDQYARLLISVGQSYHEGPKLAAAIKWAKDNFDRHVVLLGDTLQRYNMMLNGADPLEAMQRSLDMGDQWLMRHKDMLSGIEIFRWDQALAHENYMAARTKIGRLYYEEKIIKNDMDKAVEEVAIRWKIPEDKRSVFLDLSLQYLLEESAGKAVFNETYDGVSAYPGSSPSIWSLFTKLQDNDVPRGLINDHTITLELRKAG